MITTVDRSYGADADGNRGIVQIEHEIEDSDYDTIHEQVLDMIADLDEGEEAPEEMEITLICPISDEDFQFTITVGDYL